jgi:hypothetical protein
MTSDLAQQRRQLADQCLVLAKQATRAATRNSMVAMAHAFFDLAEREELNILRESLRLRALQNNIGQELRAHYELPQELPPRILTMLMQLTGK